MLRFTYFRLFLLQTVILLLTVGTAPAKEGMWLPPTLKAREADMKALGLKIPADQLYNEDGTGLNNAVVLFGSGCTGEVISNQGLLLTNHHCGYGTVQGLSSREHDYFANGFWAMNRQQELPCGGLTVTFIRKQENVTDRILYGLADTLADAEREKIISKRIESLEKGYKYTTGLDAAIKPYFNGNQYWVQLTETFRDIRLVGFPPNGIGQFGGDTDNWMWPRHTGDFSIFRIYAGKDNKPADYAAGNIPYTPKKFFTINAKGYNEGDFTMVYGFPGTTQEYLSSSQIAQITDIVDPILVGVRTQRLDVWTKHMEADRDVFLKYTSKRARIANGWKKWQGELRGLQLNHVTERRRDAEDGFQVWANSADPVAPYAARLLPQIQANTRAADSALKAEYYLQEAALGVELLSRGLQLFQLVDSLKAGKSPDVIKRMQGEWDGFFKNYDASTDKDVFRTLIPLFVEKCPDYVPQEFRNQLARHGNDYAQWASWLYETSLAADAERMKALFANISAADISRIESDPALLLFRSLMVTRNQKIYPALSGYRQRIASLNRLYMKSQMLYDRNRNFYPDANLTLRLTYGTVKGIDPDGPAGYSYQTNLDEAIAKDNPEVAEFDVPEKLKTLYNKKDYGRWKTGTSVPIAFIANNHTSGGNSGSPVLNAKGELIGTNFDRIWEGTMSDLYFDPNLCRNISLDVRYTLFVIEKFGGAGWLLKEMKVVR